MNLTDEEIQIKVHEALGWTKRTQGPTHYAWSRGDYWHYLHEVPNYSLDLNAIVPIIRNMPETDQWAIFEALLAIVPSEYPAACATAKEWCLAYLKTKGILP